MKIPALAVIGAAATLLLAGCGGSSTGSSAAPTSAAPAAQNLTVLATRFDNLKEGAPAVVRAPSQSKAKAAG